MILNLKHCLFHVCIHVQSDGGSYISWFSGEMFSGGDVYDRNYSLYEIPLFVQAGSIIPMKSDDFGNIHQL